MLATSRRKASTSQKEECLIGVVQKVRFQSENGWVVVQLDVPNQPLATVVGTAPTLAEGEQLECHGHWVNEAKWGKQFKSTMILVKPPVTTEGLERFLASGLVEGIGKHYAKKLVRVFGLELIDILDHRPSYLRIIKGIGQDRQKKVVEAWRKHKDIREILIFLTQHGLAASRALQIYRRYKSNAVNIMKENPYRLAEDIYGIGFRTADEIAMKLGIDKHAPKRLLAGLKYTLSHLEGQGHCAAPADKLIKTAQSLLELDRTTVENALTKSLQHGFLVEDHIMEVPLIYTPEMYELEQRVADKLIRLSAAPSLWKNHSVEKELAVAEQSSGIQLSVSQREALQHTLNHKVSIISGNPGTGKTSLVKTLLCLIAAQHQNLTLCAPTGRASRRLSEVTGFPAVTMHRLLGARGGNRFTHNASNLLDAVVLTADEFSMVPLRLMDHLLDALPETCHLFIVGDNDQLSSVGSGRVLGDMIESGIIPTFRLTEIHRQAKNSTIILNAHRINQGLMPIVSDHSQSDFQLVIEEDPAIIVRQIEQAITVTLPKQYGFDPIKDIQVLSPLHRGELGTMALNNRLQQLLNPQPSAYHQYGETRFGVGDKVCQIVNNYDRSVFNGDSGYIVHVSPSDKSLNIDFDGRVVTYNFTELDELRLAYCQTVHKAQGSEYRAMIMPLSISHYVMLTRRLLYTAVTRGKERVILIGQERALRTAVKNDRDEQRYTALAERLKHPTH